jgi:hypothetical protein
MNRDVSVWVFAAVMACSLVSCAPEPRLQSCHDDGDCKELVGKASYCVRQRCVECVSSSACPAHTACVAGLCQAQEGSR